MEKVRAHIQSQEFIMIFWSFIFPYPSKSRLRNKKNEVTPHYVFYLLQGERKNEMQVFEIYTTVPYEMYLVNLFHGL